jgi:hypothetical protein
VNEDQDIPFELAAEALDTDPEPVALTEPVQLACSLKQLSVGEPDQEVPLIKNDHPSELDAHMPFSQKLSTNGYEEHDNDSDFLSDH